MQAPQPPDILEHGAREQTSDRRLYMQLLVYTGCRQTLPITDALLESDADAVLYESLHDPRGIAVLAMHEDPAFFLTEWRTTLQGSAFDSLKLKPSCTMFGRTYALGYETDLNETLLERPRNTALNPDWPWAIWYPIRRSGRFEQLEPAQQRDILMEHGRIGMGYARADYAHDIRLACYGLDTHDSDFVVALTGKHLHPLSAIVQEMRKTTQTSLYLERLGPFYVGRAIWKSPRG